MNWLKKNWLKLIEVLGGIIAGIFIYLQMKPKKKTIEIPKQKIKISNPNKEVDKNESNQISSDIDTLLK